MLADRTTATRAWPRAPSSLEADRGQVEERVEDDAADPCGDERERCSRTRTGIAGRSVPRDLHVELTVNPVALGAGEARSFVEQAVVLGRVEVRLVAVVRLADRPPVEDVVEKRRVARPNQPTRPRSNGSPRVASFSKRSVPGTDLISSSRPIAFRFCWRICAWATSEGIGSCRGRPCRRVWPLASCACFFRSGPWSG